MASLTVEKVYGLESGEYQAKTVMGVAASTKIMRGAAIGLTTVSARPLTAGYTFMGFAYETVDNSAGTAGALNINLTTKGFVQGAVTGVTGSTALGTAVYMSDDHTFTLTATSNSSVGKVHRIVTGTTCVIYFEGATVRSI